MFCISPGLLHVRQETKQRLEHALNMHIADYTSYCSNPLLTAGRRHTITTANSSLKTPRPTV